MRMFGAPELRTMIAGIFFGEHTPGLLVAGVIGSWAAVQQMESWLGTHCAAIWNEAGAILVEENLALLTSINMSAPTDATDRCYLYF
jgi:hypothetical protein